MRIVRFKPLWAIHNSTYRTYKKELVRSPLARYGNKLWQRIRKQQ